MIQESQSHEKSTVKPALNKERWESFGRVAALLLAVGITVGIIVGRDQLAYLAVYGYPANFLVNLLSNATVIIPVPPGFITVLATGGVLNPIGVGIAAGLGAALGEITGYLAGWSGQGIVSERPLYQRIQKMMEKYGTLIVFVAAFVPNPVFDVVGIFAGAMRMPAWRFLLACTLGKSIRFALLALIGARFFS